MKHGPLLLYCLLLCAPASAQNDPRWLDVSIRVFSDAPAVQTTATPEQAAEPAPVIDQEVRQAEYRYLPLYLRYRLEATGRFGAVRVLPMLDNGAQLRIEGWIQQSDGSVLALRLRVTDSTGRLWLERDYRDTAVNASNASGDPLAEDDFAPLFGRIVRDLLTTLDGINAEQRARIHTVALLRYGAGLVPDAFSAYLQPTTEGSVNITRLPARDDPLLARIERIREHEYLFIDVVDQEYQHFFTEIRPLYSLWRQAQREQVQSAVSFVTRQSETRSTYRRGSYYALQESYNNYRWAKVQELYLDELSEGFANEVAPTELALEDSLYRLTGTFEQQYREWRTILAELFRLEQG